MAGGDAGTPDPSPTARAPAREGEAAPSASPDPLQRLEIPAELAEHSHTRALREALVVFEFGDYRTVRSILAPVLADSATPPPLREAAQRLTAAMGFEPGAVAVAAGCALFFLVVLWLVY